MIGTQQRGDLQHAIENACERMVTMVVNAPDLNVTVPDSPKWTARQAFAHVVTVTPRYTAGARQTGRWVDAAPQLAALNDEEIAAADPLDVTTLAARLRAELAELFAEVSCSARRRLSSRSTVEPESPPTPRSAFCSANSRSTAATSRGRSATRGRSIPRTPVSYSTGLRRSCQAG